MVAVSAPYNVVAPESLVDRIAAHQRRLMFRAFLTATSIGPSDTVLDIGTIGDRAHDGASYLAACYPHKAHIATADFDDTPFPEETPEDVLGAGPDECAFPFDDGSFDYVHSAAVLEHVGRRDRQAEFLRQTWRVARKGIFISTPNRWFPVEFNTDLPLVHWLPPSVYRSTLRRLGKRPFALEQNLNLLATSELSELARMAGIPGSEIWNVSLFLWPTDLILVALKR
jgi:hypothetical protein